MVRGANVKCKPKYLWKYKKKKKKPVKIWKKKSPNTVFQNEFKKTKTHAERIALLKQYSSKIISLVSSKKLIKMRYEHNNNKYFTSSFVICNVCNKSKAYGRHHIILLKHGGSNKRKNLIPICLYCHKLIHDWL